MFNKCLIVDPKPKPSFAITQKMDQPNLEWYDILSSSCCHFCMYSFYDVHITFMLILMSYLKSASSWKKVLFHSTNTWKACLRRMFVLRHVDTQRDQNRHDRHVSKLQSLKSFFETSPQANSPSWRNFNVWVHSYQLCTKLLLLTPAGQETTISDWKSIEMWSFKGSTWNKGKKK